MNKRALFLVLFLSIVFIANNVAFAAVNGDCGPLDGNYYREPFSPPASSLCSAGTPSSVSGSGPWSWTCRGIDGGSNDYCSAQKTSVSSALCCCTPVNGQCGSSNGGTFSSAPTYNLCSSGTQSSVSGSGPWSWNCSGKNGGATVSCSANKTQPVINGQCGSSNGATLYSAPTSNLCSMGTTSYVSGNGPWN
ncbi:MAG: hypothetical protein PHO90_00735, partial [Candidatus Pacebacteria bacterium]|nr:hypothetical protein [Candidatus Paceibacterota bacterium]